MRIVLAGTVAMMALGRPSPVEAQVLSGVLRDSASGTAGAGLYVAVRPQDQTQFIGGARADSSGHFTLTVPAGLYHMEVSLPDGSHEALDSVAARAPDVTAPSILIGLAHAEAQRMYYEFQVERHARVLQQIEPTYPSDAAGLTGEVLVQIAVDSTGTPVLPTLRVLKSPGSALTAAVAAALADWRFEPALLQGRPVRQMVQIPFVFAGR